MFNFWSCECQYACIIGHVVTKVNEVNFQLSIINYQLVEDLKAAGDPQAGGDGGQDGRYCLNDEFPSFLFHVSFF